MLVEQMQKAALSVPSNISEGHGRLSSKEWRNLLGYARGSLHELVSQIEVATKVGFLREAQRNELLGRTMRISAGITKIIRQLKDSTTL